MRGSATGQLKSAPRAERIERTLRVSQKKLLEETRARLHRHVSAVHNEPEVCGLPNLLAVGMPGKLLNQSFDVFDCQRSGGCLKAWDHTVHGLWSR